MLKLIRTNSSNPDFIRLVRLLDADLALRDGDDHAFFAQYNKIDAIKNVVLAYEDTMAVGCGAFKLYEPGVVEVKRMFTTPEGRRKGVASSVLKELEGWAGELGYQKCILETGIKQPEALGLYQSKGYQPIPNYGQYAAVESSRCFEKLL